MTDSIAASPAAADFATFWQGPLDPITYSCLASFPFVGASLRVYTYDGALKLPDGVERADARAIVADESLMTRYIADGKRSLSKFSNLFRYTMILKTGRCWVDFDVFCLRRPIFAANSFVYGHQAELDHPGSIAAGVLLFPSEHPILHELVREAGAVADLDQPWGTIGPRLVTRLIRAHGLETFARPRAEFYPVHWSDLVTPLLPAYRGVVDAATANATFLHLWNEFYNRAGYDKFVCPPAGSFLHDACRRVGTIGLFTRTYDEGELTRLLQKWLPAPA